MRRRVLIVLVASAIALVSPWLRPTARAQEVVTFQGEVLDMACYMAKDKKGPDHKSCALLCAKSGVPMGILTDAGDVYLLIDDHDNNEPYEALKKLAGSRAEVTGKKFVRQGVASLMVTASKPL